LISGLILIAIADLCGTMTLFMAIRTGGVRLLAIIRRRAGADPGSDDVFMRLRRRLHGRDSLAVFVGRLLPLVRMPVTICAGLARMPPRAFVAGAAPAGAIWAGLPVALGYAFRDHVHGIAERYTSVSHVLILLSPAIGLIVAAVTWVRRGGTPWARVRRGRALVGLAVAAATAVYLLPIAREELDRRPVPVVLPEPVREFWLAALAGLAIALLSVAIVDVRYARALRQTHLPGDRELMTESAIMTIWISLVVAIGMVIRLIERQYPTI
jgi:membrane protein DedA with SNARE-associated domain